ncbi:hypothetical protein FB451DRAFT_1553672, partial [Mycena latifolia]
FVPSRPIPSHPIKSNPIPLLLTASDPPSPSFARRASTLPSSFIRPTRLATLPVLHAIRLLPAIRPSFSGSPSGATPPCHPATPSRYPSSPNPISPPPAFLVSHSQSNPIASRRLHSIQSCPSHCRAALPCTRASASFSPSVFIRSTRVRLPTLHAIRLLPAIQLLPAIRRSFSSPPFSRGSHPRIPILNIEVKSRSCHN